MLLKEHCQDTYNAFMTGQFVTQKTSHKFSALAHNQVHEQLNAMVKGDGGAIGITENEQALRRWMVAGPELVRMLQEGAQRDKLGQNDSHHHEQLPSIQKAFQADVKCLVDVIQDAGNPFQETSTELLTLDTKVVLSNDVVHAVRTAEDLGKC